MLLNFFYIFIFVIILLNILNKSLVRIIFICVTVFMIVCYIYKNKNNLQNIIENPGISKKQEIKMDDIIDKKEQDLINLLEKYKKYNTTAYYKGIKYHKILKKKINSLRTKDYKYYGNFVDDLKLFLKLCVNNFQEISINLPTNNLSKALKTNNFAIDKNVKDLHSIVDNIYKINYKEIFEIYDKYNNSKNINQYSGFFYKEPDSYNSININELY
tara:strand:- start:538 stop:1182 length:645 start_codon:yes stop_codon:yes gene_type:complete